MEVEPDIQSFKAYINQYEGNSRFSRLLVLAEKNRTVSNEAIKMCLTMAIAEKKIL